MGTAANTRTRMTTLETTPNWAATRRRTVQIALGVATTVALAACGDDSTANSDGSDSVVKETYDEVVDAAKEEAGSDGGLVVWIGTPREETTHAALAEAFSERFDLAELDWQWVSGSSSEAFTRFIQEANAGRVEPNLVLGQATAVTYDAQQQDLFESIPWVDLFEADIPSVKEAADHVGVPEMKPVWLELWSAGRVFMFNTDQMSAAEVPRTLLDLADPAWDRKVVLTSSAFEFSDYAPHLGLDDTIAAGTAIAENSPIYAEGSTAAINAVATGQGAVTPAGTMQTVEHLKETGAPVDWVAPEIGIPVQEQWVGVPAGARSPNLAALFAAWLTSTEAQQIMIDEEGASRLSMADALGREKLDAEYPDAELLYKSSIDDINVRTEVVNQLSEVFGQAQ